MNTYETKQVRQDFTDQPPATFGVGYRSEDEVDALAGRPSPAAVTGEISALEDEILVALELGTWDEDKLARHLGVTSRSVRYTLVRLGREGKVTTVYAGWRLAPTEEDEKDPAGARRASLLAAWASGEL